jgi:hypothetical protein
MQDQILDQFNNTQEVREYSGRQGKYLLLDLGLKNVNLLQAEPRDRRMRRSRAGTLADAPNE